MSKRLFAVVLLMLSATTLAFGQGGAVKSTAGAANGPVPSGKIAIIDSRAFGEGISEMKKQLDKLETVFQPRYKELEGMQNQLVTLDSELKNPKGDQKTLRRRLIR